MKRAIFFGFLVFVIVIVVCFPYSMLRDRLFHEISEQTGLEIYSGLMWPALEGPGVVLNDVTIQYVGGKTWHSHVDFDMSTLKMFVPWYSLVTISPYLQVLARLSKTSVLSLQGRLGSGQVVVDGTVRDFDFSPFLGQLGMGFVDIVGRLDAVIKTHVKPKRQELGKTQMDAKIRRLRLGAFEAGGFSLPELVFRSAIEVALKSKDGKTFDVDIHTVSDQEPVLLKSIGKIFLDAKRPEASTFDLKNTLRISSKLKSESSVSLVLSVLDEYKKADGSYRIQIRGDFARGVMGFPNTF